MDEKQDGPSLEKGEQKKSGWPTSAKAIVGVLALVTVGAIGYGIGQSGSNEAPAPAETVTESVDEASPSKETPVDAGNTESVSSASPSEGAQEFGTPIELRGSGTTVAVAPEDFLGALKPDPYGFVTKRQELLAFTFNFVNTGDKPYDGYPSNDVVLIDSESGQWISDGEAAAPGTECEPLLVDIRLLPGSERRGCITFAVPKGTKPSELQATLDSATGPDTGVWSIPAK